MFVGTRSLSGVVGLLIISTVGCGGGGSFRGGSLGAGSTAATTSRTPAPVGSTTTPGTPAPVGTQVVARGTFKALTYNVAGLPQVVSKVSPSTNTTLISPLLNAYDLVVVQEDFSYQVELASAVTHPQRTAAHTGYSTILGDGLHAFSRVPFSGLVRTKWIDCNGWINQANDCLASKGFFLIELEPSPGVKIHFYNLHADAGRSGADANTRKSNFKQLADVIFAQSKGVAVMVAGDTNLKVTSDPVDAQTLLDFLRVAGLKDAARTIGGTETIDRIMYRNSATGDVELEAKKWRYADEMIDAAGLPLSDHEGVNVDFEWRLVK
ncbi:MAG: hypothetical protein ACAI25_03730 [Planctomycetota bacterium]